MYYLFKDEIAKNPLSTYYRYIFRPKKKKYKWLTFFGRVYAIIVTSILANIVLGLSPYYEEKVLKNFVAWQIYFLEMYPKGLCDKGEYKRQILIG